MPRIPEPREWLLTKRCTRCGATKPWAKFSPARYWPDGSVRLVASRCQSCLSGLAGGHARRYRERHGDQWRAYGAAWMRRRRAALRADERGLGTLLPVEPFRPWLRDRIEEYGTAAELGRVVGIDGKTLHRIASMNREVSLRVVDVCLTHFGMRVDDLYDEVGGFR